MADRFPSLEEFDAGVAPAIGNTSTEPSADDFLARERAVLGDDANLFATAQDATAYNVDVLGGEDETSKFKSQFPEVIPQGPSVTYNSGFAAYAEEEEEEEVIKQWRERRDAANAKRAAQFAAQREETIKEARQNIDTFYETYNAKRDKMVAQTRAEAEAFLAAREDAMTAGGTSWERIAKLVDVSGKGVKGGADGTQKERFRKLLLSLRKDEKAPGAVTY